MEADDMSLRVASFSCYLNSPEESLVQRIAGGSSEDLQRPDAPFPVRARASPNKPSSNVKIPKGATMDGSKDHKVKVSTASDHGAGESFSSAYVRTPENNNNNSGFAFKTAASGPVEDPTVSFVFPAAAKHLERRIVGKSRNDGEISIFDADKYFNMKLDQKLDLAYTTAPIRSGKVNKNKNDEIPAVESPCTKPKSKSSNVSVSSEPSSFGSKAVLLHKPKPRKAGIIRRSFFGRLGCQGRCLDKKAVVIDDHGSKQAAEDSFSSQKHSAGNTSKREEHHATTKQEEAVEEQRKSLEVFGAHKTRKGSGDVAVNLERKLSVLTWDAIPNSTTACAAPDIHPIAHTTTTSNTIYDDMASDASSDLFEIENISDSARHGLMLASQTNTSGCASPITHYAPSEASITWSVVTAGVADHSSVISDYDENTVSIKTNKFKDVTGKPSTKPRFTGLLGCNNSHGTLNISETAHNTGGDRRKLGKSIHNCHSPDDFSSPCMT